MRRIGSVVRVAQGLAVVRADDESHPDIGESALDESLSTVGRVVDVFGPVERPYVAVSPTGGLTPVSLLGEKLYVR